MTSENVFEYVKAKRYLINKIYDGVITGKESDSILELLQWINYQDEIIRTIIKNGEELLEGESKWNNG